MANMNLFAALPEIVLLVAASVILVADLFVPDERRNVTYGLSMVALVAVAAVLWLFLDNHVLTYAFNGMYVADPMTSVLKLFSVFAVGFMLVYAQGYARDRGMWKGELFTLTLFALLGIMLMISANNLLVIYLGLELQALSLYALVALRRDDARSSEAAMKYFVLGALASGFLLYGMSMLYGGSGTLDINELARRVATGQVASRVTLVLGAVFVIGGLAFKLGAVPFHMWVPDVYHGAPTPVALLIGGAPEFAAFAITIRLLVEGLSGVAVEWQQMLIVLSVASLVVGNLAAIAQTNLKRMLAYSTIGQMGFMLLGLTPTVVGANTLSAANAYSSSMFYMVAYVLTTLGTFGLIMLLSRQGFESDEISDLAGLGKRAPWMAGVMTILMFSLAGVPPLVGFYAKLSILQALVTTASTPYIVLAVFAVLMSLVGAFYYLR